MTSNKTPSAYQKRRWSRIVELGCVACAMDGNLSVPPDIHHLLSGGVRIGHSATVGLCPWHHRGVGNIEQLTKERGPSLAHNTRDFEERYGTPSELLEIQNEMLKHYLEQIGARM